MRRFQNNRTLKDSDKRVIYANLYRINCFQEVHFSKAGTRLGHENQRSYSLILNGALNAVFHLKTTPFIDIINLFDKQL